MVDLNIMTENSTPSTQKTTFCASLNTVREEHILWKLFTFVCSFGSWGRGIVFNTLSRLNERL